MINIFKRWVGRYLGTEEPLIMLLLLVGGLLAILTIGKILAPVLASIVLAFLMQGTIGALMRYRVPEKLAVILAYILFIGVFFTILLLVVPLAWNQLKLLLGELPGMVIQVQGWIANLPTNYPDLVSDAQVRELNAVIGSQFSRLGQQLVSQSVASLTSLFSLVIYLILVPLLVFFFLKDKAVILSWLGGFLPARRPFLSVVWNEMNVQAANYVRGKVIEIIIVGGTTYAAFQILGLNYAALLGILVGLSVLIPYIGAAVVTIPVILVAFYQWGWGNDFLWAFSVYMVIQALDGNVLVPLLFSEAVNLHPVAIILAALVFGGIWGFWGVFFAIPLATLIKALLNAWPTPEQIELEEA